MAATQQPQLNLHPKGFDFLLVRPLAAPIMALVRPRLFPVRPFQPQVALSLISIQRETHKAQA